MNKKAFFIFILLLNIFSTSQAQDMCGFAFDREIARETKSQDLVISFEASGNKSQYQRDNTRHYWKYNQEKAPVHPLIQQLLRYTGYIIGDAHMGNFIFSNLQKKMQYFIADIKDAGQAPFILDINRLMLTTDTVLMANGEKTSQEVYEKIYDAYVEGLKGIQRPLHKKLIEDFSVTYDTYNADVQAYVLGQMKKKKELFKKKEGKVEALSEAELALVQTDIINSVHKAYPDAEVLDTARRPRERGGSKDLLRYWALIKEKDGNFNIVEFKEIGDPATAQYGPQESAQSVYEQIMKIYWPERDSIYQITSLNGQSFWMRPKKVDVISVPYKLKKKKDVKYTLALAMRAANYMGINHGKQLADLTYTNQLQNNKNEMISALIKFNSDYNQELFSQVDFIKMMELTKDSFEESLQEQEADGEE